MKADTKSIGNRLKSLREYSGLTKKDFGTLFRSKESTVYQWENGCCVPRLAKLINIATYFGISLDCILCGRVVNDHILESHLCGLGELPFSSATSRIISRYNTLSARDRERLIGYLDALSREHDVT
ncbi:MAG: helix-turn-helix domain-containing protein [Oscillospiraceae bacterium]|nr:helix-turn-helix domain-containing protein [Oscillospiraceae bacterium]